MRALETLFKNTHLQFQIVSNSVRMHSFETFSNCSLQFQIVIKTVRMHALETLFPPKYLQF